MRQNVEDRVTVMPPVFLSLMLDLMLEVKPVIVLRYHHLLRKASSSSSRNEHVHTQPEEAHARTDAACSKLLH